jgi:hypoxanthine phosphoribosyltransferase
VDDTRTTLQYAVQELEKDVKQAAKELGRENEETKFFVFVLHVSYPTPGMMRACEGSVMLLRMWEFGKDSADEIYRTRINLRREPSQRR